MKKKWLLCDLGNVFIKFDEWPFQKILKRSAKERFVALYSDHDRGVLSPEDLVAAANKECFTEFLPWVKFWATFDSCIKETNIPMFLTIEKFKKEKRGKLVMITDNNPFGFFVSTLKFPGVFELFREGKKERWIYSSNEKSLKIDVGLFARASAKFGFLLKDAAFVDDRAENGEAFVKCGGAKDAFFLYKLGDPENHKEFEKFLNKHFPAKA